VPAWRINFIIMKQFTLPLIEDNSRPIIKIENFFNIYAMLDTGAVIPVWIKNENFLEVKDSGGKLHILCSDGEIKQHGGNNAIQMV